MHRACNLARPVQPSFDWERLNEFWLEFLIEEHDELREAILDRDKVATVHELVDLLYVAYGMAVASGIDLEPFWEEVHRVNMEKAHGPKSASGKQLKPVNWEPADMSGLYKRIYGQ